MEEVREGVLLLSGPPGGERRGWGVGRVDKIISHGLTDVISDLPLSFQVDYGPVR